MRASATTVPGATRGSRLNWTLVALSAVAIAGFFVSQYLTGSLAELAHDRVGLSPTYAKQPPPVQIAFYAHVVFSGAALMLGPWQFVRWIRRHHIRVHRFVGRTYLGCVAVGAAAGLILAPFNTAGMVGFFGFGTLAVLWAWTGRRAYRAVRARDIRNHQAWMIRSFALTYAAVTLRLWLVALIFIQLPFRSGFAGFPDAYAAAYPAVPFLCWLPNIVVAEWLVRRRGLPAMRITPPAPAS